MWLWAIWLIGGLILVGVEVHTQAFFAIFLALGAFAATIFTVLGFPVWVAAVVFAGVALAGTVLLRPTLRRISQRHLGPPLLMTGASDNIVGQRALTLDSVGDEHHPGHARLGNESWLAFTRGGQPLEPETPVTVVDVRGTTLVVMPLARS